jgi:hypothetical protein
VRTERAEDFDEVKPVYDSFKEKTKHLASLSLWSKVERGRAIKYSDYCYDIDYENRPESFQGPEEIDAYEKWYDDNLETLVQVICEENSEKLRRRTELQTKGL